ncbi:uncharacterized protein LOC117759113 [Hippoglossus hippoglossus]|uniref:uncharacterized protein LOC117759113 n=1 Tax=Hippoglossus hippoglossus TaxID=8267 RepID=UPI00148E236F|nr:uncharacterized protein LOC117759113 [Hippoglossus hippoglossus]
MLEDVCTEEELDEGFGDAGLDHSLDLTIELLEMSSGPSPTSFSTPSSLHATAAPPRPGCSSSAAASEHHLIEYEDTEMPPGPSAPPASYLLPSSTSLSAAVSAAATVSPGPSASPPVTPAVARRALDFPTRVLSGPSAITTSSASMLPLPATLSTTVPTATASSGSQTTTPAAPGQHLAVDERGVPGMDGVDCLADYLVGLRNETGLTLNNLQASTIIALWQNLLPYDRQRVEYAARHQSRLTTGRYRVSKKKAEFTPGVESMTRCVLGSTGSPAQWPDCCRLIESIFVKLCNIYKSPKKQGNYALTRWTLILKDYSKIRQLVLGNGVVMQTTTLQLFEVNQTTLIQWHNKRLKRQECGILLQGVNLPPSIPVASVPLPPMQSRPTAAPPQLGPQHQYHLPQSTAGKAVDKRKSVLPAQHLHPPKAFCPGLPSMRQLVPQQARPHTSAPMPIVPQSSPVIGPIVVLPPQVPAVKLLAPAGPLPIPSSARRRYIRTTEKNKCSQCQQPRTLENGHRQYYGYVYCPFTTDMPHDQWLEDMRRKRAAKK